MSIKIILSAAGKPDIIEAAETLREATAMRRYADDEADGAKVKIQAFIVSADAEDCDSVQINAGRNIVKVTQYERVVLDTKALAEHHPEIFEEFSHVVLCKRFSVSDA